MDIPVPKSQDGGIFNEHGPDVADRVVAGKAMAKATEQTISENYGVAFAPFMDAVCADLDSTVERVKRNAALFVEKVAPEADAKTTRLVEKFGIIYADAIESCKFGIAPWTERRARDAITSVCLVALKRLAEEPPVDSAIEKLRVWLQHPRRFPAIENGESLPPDLKGQAKGFRRSKIRQFVAVLPEDLQKIVGGREIAEKVLKRLVDKGSIWMDGDKRGRKVQVSGFGTANRERWY